MAALLEKKNAQEAREAKRRKEQEEEEALERILGTSQICIEELMDTMMCYSWTSRTRLAPNWVRIPPQVPAFVLTSQVFGTPEQGANIRQGYTLLRTQNRRGSVRPTCHSGTTLQKCGQELDEAIAEDEPRLRVYELVSAQLDKHYGSTLKSTTRNVVGEVVSAVKEYNSFAKNAATTIDYLLDDQRTAISPKKRIAAFVSENEFFCAESSSRSLQALMSADVLMRVVFARTRSRADTAHSTQPVVRPVEGFDTNGSASGVRPYRHGQPNSLSGAHADTTASRWW
jgi:hypothetical protein